MTRPLLFFVALLGVADGLGVASRSSVVTLAPSRAMRTAGAAFAVAPVHAATAATAEAGVRTLPPDYWATPHPEYAAALVLHWLLWGYSSRQVALTYDFACIAGLVYVQTLPVGGQ